MANIFENIVSPVGGAIRGVARGLFPGAAKAADLQTLQQQIMLAGGPYQPAGRQLLIEYFDKIKSSPELKQKLLQSPQPFGGALSNITGQPGGMIPKSISIDEKGMPSLTLERGPTEREIFKETAGYANELRDEYNALSKDFFTVRDAYNRVSASSEEPSAAGDLALIFNYMKVLDPGSVVRESEFSTAAQAGAYGERIKAAVNRVISGERLSDEMRKDFVDRAERLYKAQEKTHKAHISRYTSLAKRYKIDPKYVFGEITESQQEQLPDNQGGAAQIQARLDEIDKLLSQPAEQSLPAPPQVSGEAPELPVIQTRQQQAPAPVIASPEVIKKVAGLGQPKRNQEFRNVLKHISDKKVAQAYYNKWRVIMREIESFDNLWKPISGSRK